MSKLLLLPTICYKNLEKGFFFKLLLIFIKFHICIELLSFECLVGSKTQCIMCTAVKVDAGTSVEKV